MEYHVLASGSKGNSCFVYDNGTGVLIDCGISRKQLLYKLDQVGFAFEDINFVLLTHDHYDHNKNITIFDNNIVYAGAGALKQQIHTLVPYEAMQMGKMEILPLSVSHDATSPLAYIFKGSESLLYMTDTGYISQKNMKYMKSLNYYIIESNHDVQMLMDTKRPYFLKRRILDDSGHLNNEYSARMISQVINEDTKEIVLAHLSEEANSPDVALSTYHSIFESVGISFTNIKVASQVNIVSGGKKNVG